MIGEASAAIGSIKAAMDIAKGASGLKAATDINLAVIEIQRALLDAQSAAFEDKERILALQSRVAELESTLARAGDWTSQKSRYSLVETATGALVYNLKPECSDGEPDHRLCVKCFDEGRKSVLQVTQRHSGGERVECKHCHSKLTLTPFAATQIDSGNGQEWLVG